MPGPRDPGVDPTRPSDPSDSSERDPDPGGSPVPRQAPGPDDPRTPLSELLALVALAAVPAVPGAAAAGVALVTDGRPGLGAASDEDAARLDAAQVAAGAGPAVDALRTGRTQVARDLAALLTSGHRVSGHQVSEDPVSGDGPAAVSVPIAGDGQTAGVLTVYFGHSLQCTEGAVRAAESFAASAARLLADAMALRTSRRLVAQLSEALISRAVIDQAKGVLIERHGGDADDAFARLREASMSHSVKLRDLARSLVDDAGRTRDDSRAADIA